MTKHDTSGCGERIVRQWQPRQSQEGTTCSVRNKCGGVRCGTAKHSTAKHIGAGRSAINECDTPDRGSADQKSDARHGSTVADTRSGMRADRWVSAAAPSGACAKARTVVRTATAQ